MSKLRVVWNNGTEQIFEGTIGCYGEEIFYVISSNKKIYISMYQARYIEPVE